MAKVIIPEGLERKDLIDFLVANKSALINQKKSVLKHTEAISCTPDRFVVDKDGSLKDIGGVVATVPVTEDELLVKTVANACNWCDSDMDVLIRDSAKKSINQRKSFIPHLHDHVHMCDAQIGDVKDVYLEDVPLRKLGLNKSGSTQCIIFETNLVKSYHPRVFDLYKAGKINQHSIGLKYIRIELAVNEPDYEKEQDFWKKYYDLIINKEVVDEAGYFWVVQEFMLLENSCVLFGSNELTPTLEIGQGKSHSAGTAGKASQSEPTDQFDLNVAILTTKFFKSKNF